MTIPATSTTQTTLAHPVQQLLAEQPTSHYTTESFGNQPGAEVLANRLNQLGENLKTFPAYVLAYMCDNFTTAFNLHSILVTETSQLNAIKILLAANNCTDPESIQFFAEKFHDIPDTEPGVRLKDTAAEDNLLEITHHEGHQGQPTTFNHYRQPLLEHFIVCAFPEPEYTVQQQTLLKDALTLAGRQITGNWGFGCLDKPLPYSDFNRETVAHLAACLSYPRQPECAKVLAQIYMGIQEALFNPKSSLCLLLEDNQNWLLIALLTEDSDNPATLSNEAALMLSLTASKDHPNAKILTDEIENELERLIEEVGICPTDLGHFADANLVLNFAGAAKKKQLANDDIRAAELEVIRFADELMGVKIPLESLP
ncbi:hypothetical protein J7438_06050 [Thalassotalea sp. G20_0]|uniref:hypothetical protein n=1 Tax=Thalassotalea sp. G20_0 TaxID=2821093 RepID=UPI001ADB5DC1|nr:hypothetical protein [Thalassotalea sp. G20_0]MBO9493645.1 hypothetical protein [Thalassotalea sp. G20_0]